jgi:hypothetical protein
MKVYFSNLMGIALLLTLGCILIITPQALAAKPLSDGEAKYIVEEGKNSTYIMTVPVGSVKIFKFSNADDKKNLIFKTDFVYMLNLYKKIGIVNFERLEGKISDTYSVFNVSITEKGKRLAFKTNTAGEYEFKTANMKITKIVKNEDHDRENRIVLGIYEFTLTEFGKEIYSETNTKFERQYKIKALLKYDDFKGKYYYVESDYGLIEKKEFETIKLFAF